jgi:RimJ/RimL family protein N-acetyltransferase
VSKLPMMPGVVQRFLRAAREGETPAQCGRECHVLHMPGLRLQTPTKQDARIMLAAASDPQAQRWLGWTGPAVIPQWELEHQLARTAGRGRAFPRVLGPGRYLVAIDPAPGRVAGAFAVDGNTGEVGGWLAPRYRGRGLGSGLFAGAAEFAHQHLGIPSVTAGTEISNAACIAALASAGFILAAGPDTQTLPDGRVVPVRWFRHESAYPTVCAA